MRRTKVLTLTEQRARHKHATGPDESVRKQGAGCLPPDLHKRAAVYHIAIRAAVALRNAR